MPLLAVLDETAHGALDESLKTLYVQNTENKQFYLDLPSAEAEKLAFDLQKRFEAKKNDLQRVHGEKAAAETKLKAYEGLGKSPDELKEALSSNRPEDVNRLLVEKDEKHKTEIDQLRSSYEEPMKAAKEKAERLEQNYRQTLQTSAIAKLRNDFDLNETADYVLRDFIRVEPTEEGDEYTVRVYENGQPALVAGQAKTPEQLLTGFKEGKKFEAMFNAGTGGGSGATNRTTITNGKKAMKRSEFNALALSSPQEAAKYTKEGGEIVDD